MGPGSVGRGREKGVREGREAFGGGARPRGTGPPAGGRRDSAICWVPRPACVTRAGPLSLLAGHLTVPEGSHPRSQNYVEVSLNSLEEKSAAKIPSHSHLFLEAVGVRYKPLGSGVRSSETGPGPSKVGILRKKHTGGNIALWFTAGELRVTRPGLGSTLEQITDLRPSLLTWERRRTHRLPHRCLW